MTQHHVKYTIWVDPENEEKFEYGLNALEDLIQYEEKEEEER